MITAEIENSESRLQIRTTATLATISDAAQWGTRQIVDAPYLVCRIKDNGQHVATIALGLIEHEKPGFGIFADENVHALVNEGVRHYVNSTRPMPEPSTVEHHRMPDANR